MSKRSISFYLLILFTAVCAQANAAIPPKPRQLVVDSTKPLAQSTPECAGQIYSATEIPRNQRAKLKSRPFPSMTQQALNHDVHGRVVIEAVLCRTGAVTDLRIIEGLPYGMNEAAVHAVSTIRFTPAEMNWHSVSQRQRFEFHFNERGETTSKVAAGLLVEAIEVVGNRRFTDSGIMQYIKSRPGDNFDEQQIQRDLAALLSTGHFNALSSRVSTENGVRGGVVVVFEVHELPLISDVNFRGIDPATASNLVDALRRQQIDLRKGAVYDTAKVKIATELIRRLLEPNGQGAVKVETLTENLSATNVSLTFVISRE